MSFYTLVLQIYFKIIPFYFPPPVCKRVFPNTHTRLPHAWYHKSLMVLTHILRGPDLAVSPMLYPGLSDQMMCAAWLVTQFLSDLMAAG